MMRKLAVCVDFMNDGYRRQIDQTAAPLGFTVHYYDTQAALTPHIGDYEVLYGHPSPALLRQAARLRWLCSDYAGVEKYLDDAVWPSGDCLLTNSSGAYGPAISEHILMVLLMLLRRMPEHQAAMAQRQWTAFQPIRSIAGSHVVMLGAGDIGRNTARRLAALGAAVTGVCRSGTSDESAFQAVLPISGLDAVLPQADVLIMALPATPETNGILARERIARLPRHACLINVGRGAAIDQEALTAALLERRLAGAALDVMVPEPLPADHPLWDCPNVVLTPHVSGNMALGLTCERTVEMFCENLRRYAEGQLLRRLVDRKKGY